VIAPRSLSYLNAAVFGGGVGASNWQTPHGRDGANVQTRRKYSKTLQIQYVIKCWRRQAIPLLGRPGVEFGGTPERLLAAFAR
jgi:hypothetical protein